LREAETEAHRRHELAAREERQELLERRARLLGLARLGERVGEQELRLVRALVPGNWLTTRRKPSAASVQRFSW
jgi:hypothetical protein